MQHAGHDTMSSPRLGRDNVLDNNTNYDDGNDGADNSSYNAPDVVGALCTGESRPLDIIVVTDRTVFAAKNGEGFRGAGHRE